MKSIFIKLIDGLPLFEIILMLSGLLVLIVLLILLVFLIYKNRNYTPIFYGFVIPIIMMGWSSIKSIEINGIIKAMKTQVAETIQHPTEDNYQKLDSINKISNEYKFKSPENNLLLAKTNILLSNPQKAEEELNKINLTKIDQKELQELKSSIENIKNTEALISQSTASPDDTTLTAGLEKNVSELKDSKLPTRNSKIIIQRAEHKIKQLEARKIELQTSKNKNKKTVK